MHYAIEIDRRALKAMRSLPKKIQQQIARHIDSLAANPFPPDAQPIKGQTDIYRIRSGSYRIAYTVQNKVLTVLVLHIGDRKDFYRHF